MNLELMWFEYGCLLLLEHHVPLLWLEVMTSREGIRLALLGTRAVRDHKVEIGQEQGPACLSSVQDPRGSKVLQVSMVAEDGDGVLGPIEVVPPLFKCCYDSQQLLIVYIIVYFCS